MDVIRVRVLHSKVRLVRQLIFTTGKQSVYHVVQVCSAFSALSSMLTIRELRRVTVARRSR